MTLTDDAVNTTQHCEQDAIPQGVPAGMSRIVRISQSLFVPKYLPYLFDTRRQQHLFGGAGSGKSKFVAQRTVLDLLQGFRNYLCLRKVDNTIRQSTFAEIRDVISSWSLSEHFAINKSDMTITCIPTQRQAIFRGVNDPEKLKSARPQSGPFTDVWYEEATEFSKDDVYNVAFRLRGTMQAKDKDGNEIAVPKRETMTYNPVVYGHWIHREYQNCETVDKIDHPDLLVLKSTYRDNPYLAPDDIERYESMRARSDYHAQVYLDGVWGNLAGAIITNWRTEDLSGRTFDHVWHGLDFGFNPDPAAYIQVAVQGNAIYILKEAYGKGMRNATLADLVLPLCGDSMVWCDSAEPKSISELRACGVNARPVSKGKDSVRFGAQWLQQREIVIDSSCINAQREISQWQWEKDKQGNELPEPVGINDHAIAALRYALERVMAKRNLGIGVITSSMAA